MDLKQALKARDAASANRFSLYLPDRDRDGAPVLDIAQWIEAAMHIMADINGGATCLPASLGLWSPADGATVRENTRVVFSFLRDTQRFEANIG